MKKNKILLVGKFPVASINEINGTYWMVVVLIRWIVQPEFSMGEKIAGWLKKWISFKKNKNFMDKVILFYRSTCLQSLESRIPIPVVRICALDITTIILFILLSQFLLHTYRVLNKFYKIIYININWLIWFNIWISLDGWSGKCVLPKPMNTVARDPVDLERDPGYMGLYFLCQEPSVHVEWYKIQILWKK